MTRPLEGLRVLDLSGISAGFRATAVLADYGAAVIVVEPPGGDGRRESDPAGFSVFHRGKRSVVLDLQADRAVVVALLDTVDVLFESFRPAEATALGFGREQLHASHPHLVHCSLSGFGTDGPYRDLPPYEALVHAVVGTMAEQMGHRDGPIFEGIPFASIGAAHLALIGVLAAVHRRAVDGVGRHVETSLFDGALVYMTMYWSDSDVEPTGTTTTQMRSTGGPATTRIVSGMFRCADDRFLGVGTPALGAFDRLMSVLGLDDRIAPSPSAREMGILLLPEEKLVLDEIHGIFAGDTCANWEQKLLAADVCAMPLQRPCEIFDSPQALLNTMVATVDDPQLGPVEQVAPAIQFSGSPLREFAPAPTLGQHTAAVLDDLRSPRELFMVGSGPHQEGPLLGDVKILDLGVFLAGPFASRMLADLGATVLKVEAPSGDNLRGVGRMFRSAAAGKRSIAADLHDPDCAKLFEALVRWADVAHHNLRPRVFTRLGMDGASVRRINPEVIFGYSPGWGSTGANADRQSLEPHMSGYAGVAYEAAGQWNEPVYPICNSDVGNGLVGAVGIMIALVERLRTGRGRTYENAHLNAAMMHVAHIVRGADGEAIGADRLDPMQFGFGPYERLYMTSDGWICIAAMTPDEIAGLWTAIARHQPAEADNDQLGDIIAEAIGTRTTTHWLQALDAHGVPAVEPSPYNAALFLRDPENRKSGRVAECDHPTLGRLRELALLVRVSDCDELTHRLAPELGADTMELLRWAGYDDETIAALNNQGVVRCTSAADGSSIG